MESAPKRDAAPLDAALLAAAAAAAADAAAEVADPAKAADAAVAALHGTLAGIFPSVFVLEHGRLWLVAQRGYAVVPDGIRVERGIMGRAVRLGRPQLVRDVRTDADYVPALPGVRSELAVPLRVGRVVLGALNVESERLLPADAARLVRPLAAALAPLAAALRAGGALDLAALARLFVHLGSLRDAGEIASLATASLSKVLRVEVSQVVLWNDEEGSVRELASWCADGAGSAPLSGEEIARVRPAVDSSVVCQLLDATEARLGLGNARSVVWLPLRANGEDLGALLGVHARTIQAGPAQLDTAALLAAHVAASLDVAAALERERHSATTDPLTGIMNRRGLEERLEDVLGEAQEQRMPVSVLVIDCDDFKEINDRAGHGFGDALLVEIAQVLERSLPAGATAARLGGDEFVVVLPGAGVDAAQRVGTSIRAVLRDGLTDAGFPLRMSGGVATYPFDGANGSMLVRAADQALYAAKDRGKDQVVSFRDVVTREHAPVAVSTSAGSGDERRSRPGRTDGSVLAEAVEAAEAIELEESADGVCTRLCKALVFVVGATACMTSRVVGDLLVDASAHALREISMGDDVSYRLSDFPLTSRVLESTTPLGVSFLDDDVDPAEAFVLRELGMNALLMLPLRVAGKPWGLVELYDMRLRRFTEDDIAVARFVTTRAERRLEVLDDVDVPVARSPVYELPPGALRRGPRTR